jgi:hypothetical protein
MASWDWLALWCRRAQRARSRDGVSVNEAMARATLGASSRLEIRDPLGNTWTVLVIRPDHLRSPAMRMSSWGAYPATFKFLRRLVTRDHRWNVEVLPGVPGSDLRKAVVVGTEPSKAAAKDEAVRLAMAIQSGETVPALLD